MFIVSKSVSVHVILQVMFISLYSDKNPPLQFTQLPISLIQCRESCIVT